MRSAIFLLLLCIYLNCIISLNEDSWLVHFAKYLPMQMQGQSRDQISWRQSNKCRCGVAPNINHNDNERIVGGILTKKDSWPWMGAVVFVGYETPKILCGASIINSRYLLTAGHCADFIKTEGIDKFRVFLGTNELDGPDKIVLQIKSVIIHPKFNRTTKFYDAALIKLKEDLEFNSSISPICIAPQIGVPYRNRSAVVVGWGATSYGGTTQTMQMQAMVNIISNDDCQNDYTKSEERVEISSEMMCASSLNADACQGDSGGPLFLRKNESLDIFQQVGVVSFGNGCADMKFPGIYTRIGKILSWIKSTTIDATYCKSK